MQVLIIGAARQGMALAEFLAVRGAQVVLNDNRNADQLQAEREQLSDLPVQWILGGHPHSLLEGTDLVCPSGGVPLTISLIVEAQKRGIPLSNDSQIFLEEAPCKVIGITGSAGKSTTTTLVGRMAKQSQKMEDARRKAVENRPQSFFFHPSKVWVGGNIGHPLISDLDQMAEDDLAVMELSSFQLEVMTRSPQIAAVLNITPNHLDRHLTMEAYTSAKKRILDYQREEDIAILGHDDPGAWKLAGSAQGSCVTFGVNLPPEGRVGFFLARDQIRLWDGETSRELFPRNRIRLRGKHNLLNVLAACSIAYAAGLSVESMQAGVDGFAGIPHRLEFVRSWGGADWYNNSIDTAPERVIAAIQAFEEPIVLMLGGRDKDLPWDDLADLVHRRVDHVVLFGEAAGLIEQALSLNMQAKSCSVTRCVDLEEAVHSAAEVVESGDVVLFSPGGTSFDAFRDFAERGEQFKLWVNELP